MLHLVSSKFVLFSLLLPTNISHHAVFDSEKGPGLLKNLYGFIPLFYFQSSTSHIFRISSCLVKHKKQTFQSPILIVNKGRRTFLTTGQLFSYYAVNILKTNFKDFLEISLKSLKLMHRISKVQRKSIIYFFRNQATEITRLLRASITRITILVTRVS